MTRMWMGDPSEMCGNHLLGEHKEIHQLVGSLKRGLGVKGYIRNNCIEIGSIQKRHDELVTEMLKRGWKHESPIPYQEEIIQYTKHLTPEEVKYIVDVEASDRDRFGRCIRCRRLRDGIQSRG